MMMGRGARSSFSSMFFIGLVAGALYVGCSEDNQATTEVTATSTTVTGAGAGSPCNFGGPDGFCVPSGPAAESCECQDCTFAALCTGGCVDDGVCDLGGAEDCSCEDCFYKVQSCPPNVNAGNCDDQPGCGATDACTCPDCTNEPFCMNNCVDNGECVPAFEGCSCADCTNVSPCGGNPTTTTTGGGAGGSGGTSSTGGAGGTSAGGAGGS
jgi:hypothetical protein